MRILRKILLSFVLLLLAFLFIGCGEKEEGNGALLSIDLDSSAVKTELYVGDTFNYEGLKVVAKYEKSELQIELKDVTIDTSLVDTTKKGEYVVTITYEGQEAYFKVKVSEKPVEPATLVEIVVDFSLLKTTLEFGERLDLTKISAKARYSDNTEKAYTDYTVDESGIDYGTAGTYKLKVNYEGGSQEVTITIKEEVVEVVTLTSIAVSGAPVNFNIGKDFSAEGLKVTATYSDGSSKEVTEFTVDSSAYNKEAAEEYEIIVKYAEEGVEVSAKYKVIVVDNIDSMVIDTTNVKVDYSIGDAFTSENLAVKLVLKNEDEEALTDYALSIYNSDNEEVTELSKTGDYKVVISYLTYTAEYAISVTNNGFFEVNNVEDFLAMRTYSNEGVNDGKWLLMADLDFAGVALPDLNASTDVFTGVFDGNGHKLSNITYATNTAKLGAIFATIKGGEVKNLTIFGATVSQSAESVGIICGTCTDATFTNIEFSSCTVSNTSSSGYAALICGRNTAKGTVKFSKITVKNMSSVSSIKYLGSLIGDITSGCTVTVDDVDINVTLTSGSQIGGLLGRVRGGDITINNAILRLTFGDYNNGGTTNKTGALIDGCAGCTLKANAVVIQELKKEGTALTASDTFLGNGNSGIEATITDCYCIANSALTTSVTGIDTVNGEEDLMFYRGLGYDVSNTWEEDSRFGLKIKGSSSNVPSAGATIVKVILVEAKVQKQFYVGDTFTSNGLIVIGQYSDGVVITLDDSDYNISVVNNDLSEAGEFGNLAVGNYKAKVAAGTAASYYDIDIVQEIGIEVVTDNANKVFIAGTKADTKNLIVFIKISDGTRKLASDSQFTAKLVKNDDTLVDIDTDLTKDYKAIRIYRAGNEAFYQDYAITVLDSVTLDGVAIAYVAETEKVEDGVPYFNSVNKALQYFKALNLADDVIKEIRVMSGKYYGVITIDMPNVRIVKAEADKTYKDVILYANNASDTKTLDDKTTYGTDGSATVTIKATATGFYAYGIYFKNEFDYNGTNLANKQALALLCQADQSTFVECGFFGYQDTLEAKSGRQYYKDCYIAGSVDYIFGNNAASVFDGCEIHQLTRYKSGTTTPETNQGYICAPKGFASDASTDSVKYNYVFLNCKFTAEEDVPSGSVSIARPWGVYAGVAVINCELGAHISTVAYDGSAKSRYADMSGNAPTLDTVNFVEYNNTGAGAINTAVAGCTILTETEAAMYTLANVFGKSNGKLKFNNDWMPELYAEAKYVAIGFVAKYATGETFVAPTIVKIEKDKATKVDVVATIDPEIADELADGTYTYTAKVGDDVVYTNTFEVSNNTAEKVTYVLNISELVANGDLAAGNIEAVTALPDGFFKLNADTADAKGQFTIDANGKKIDGYEFTYRLKMNGKGSTTIRNIEFTITNPAKVTIYVLSSSSGDLTRTVDVLSSESTSASVVTSACAPGSFGEAIVYELNNAGTYYITSLVNGVNFYAVIVDTTK